MRKTWKMIALTAIVSTLAASIVAWRAQTGFAKASLERARAMSESETSAVRRTARARLESLRAEVIREAAAREATGKSSLASNSAFEIVALAKPTESAGWHLAWAEKSRQAAQSLAHASQASRWAGGFDATLLAGMPFDRVRDFQAVTLLASAPFYLMTHPSLPVKTVKELTALAKARPGQLNYGSSGNGTPPHMAAEMYKSMAGLNIVHVPYRAVAAAVTDHIAGQIQVSFQYGPSSLPVVRAGRLRGLAVSSLKRSRFAPELPTMDESGVTGYEIIGWNGIHVPLKTPAEIINKLNTDLRQALQSPEVQERLTAASLDIHGTTRAEFEAFVNKDRARWAKVVKDAGITPE